MLHPNICLLAWCIFSSVGVYEAASIMVTVIFEVTVAY